MKLKLLSLLLMMIHSIQSTPVTGEETRETVLSRPKRTIGDFPFAFGRVSLVGLRLQILPTAPLGATNQALFDVDVTVPKWLAFLVPGQ